MYVTAHGADGVYLDEQMITKDPLNLIPVPAPFPKCLSEHIHTTCSAVSFSKALTLLCHQNVFLEGLLCMILSK